jgi:hypothetical protein
MPDLLQKHRNLCSYTYVDRAYILSGLLCSQSLLLNLSSPLWILTLVTEPFTLLGCFPAYYCKQLICPPPLYTIDNGVCELLAFTFCAHYLSLYLLTVILLNKVDLLPDRDKSGRRQSSLLRLKGQRAQGNKKSNGENSPLVLSDTG